jgi:DNA-binding XRE family transcriptional regulator
VPLQNYLTTEHVLMSAGMLTRRQLAILRGTPGTNRVAAAISLAGVSQMTVAAAIGVSQAYVSDVARGRYATITVASAGKFARYFGCSIEDLFPLPTEDPVS